jgi:hypothetical protein
MRTALDDSNTLPAPDPASAQRLFQLGLVAVMGCAAWFLWRAAGELDLVTFFGLAILFVSTWPALNWARLRQPWFPAFEITQLACAAFYAFPLLNRHSDLVNYSGEVLASAGGLVLLYLVVANLAFAFAKRPVRPPRWATTSLLPENVQNSLPWLFNLCTLYLYIEAFTKLVPPDLQGSLRALFFGLGVICTFVQCQQIGLGGLSQQLRALFFVNLSLQLIMMTSQLYLIGSISLFALAVIAYAAARRRIPWLALGVVVPVVALLHLGKSEMRRVYWEEKKPAPGLLDLPGFYGEWFHFSLNREFADAGARRQASIIERASLIHMICMAVDRVPETKPHLNGSTYASVPAFLIPRFFWPGKPSSLLANVQLALHYELVNPNDPYTVSIAFGLISEAYTNFGALGVAALGLVLGLLYKRVTLASVGTPQFSALGILMILLTAWSFQAEFILATWIASLGQAAAVCIGLPLLYQQFTTR